MNNQKWIVNICYLCEMEVYEIIQPSPSLAPYIAYYWRVCSSGVEGGIQRIEPTGCMQLLFYFSDKVYSFSRSTQYPRSYLCGQVTGYEDLKVTGEVDVIGIVFHPYGARAFFPFPMSSFYNSVVDIDQLHTPWLKELEESLHLLTDDHSKIREIENRFMSVLSGKDQLNIQRLLPSIRSASMQPGMDVHCMAELSCLSTKQYKRVFSEYVGMNPKEFLRVIRFQRALYLLRTDFTGKFQDVAFDCGYYDLSHMVHDFRLFSGYSPSGYMAVCTPYSDYFSGR